MRAGEGESEAENYVLTNPVAKTSMSSGLSQRGKAQVCDKIAQAARMPLRALDPQGHESTRPCIWQVHTACAWMLNIACNAIKHVTFINEGKLC